MYQKIGCKMKKAVLLLIITKIIILLSLTILKASSEISDNSIWVKCSHISENNHIVWKLESERDIDFYTIEVSSDAKIYYKLADISSIGNSEREIVYSFLHKNAGSSISFYRIAQISKSGEIAYSKTFNDKTDL